MSSSAQTHASKKRKADQEPATDPPLADPVLERSSTFWLDDGNIILQTPTTQFRVHKSVLNIHSTFFKDMFTLAQADDQPTVDGCPVVSVTDAEEDWDTLLTMLYHTEPMYFVQTNVLGTVSLIPMLRLGQKYEFERFKTEALEQLHLMYPRTLEGLDDMFNEALCESNPSMRQLQTVGNSEAFEMLNAMTELRIETVLPVLYFRCVRERSLVRIYYFRGMRWQTTVSTSQAEIFEGRDSPDDSVFLSKEMQFALALGKEKICERYLTTTFSWWHRGKVASSCISRASCKKTVNNDLRRMLEDNEDAVLYALDALGLESGLCQECDKEARTAHTIGRQALLDALPSFFGLPPWDQLKDF